MLALSLTQPWAQLMADELKRVETRDWKPGQFQLKRGDYFAIAASKGWKAADRGFARDVCHYDPTVLPLGAVVAIGRFKGAYPTELFHQDPRFTPEEESYGDYGEGRFGWVVDRIVKLEEPVPCKGALGLWKIPPDVLNAIFYQTGVLA